MKICITLDDVIRNKTVQFGNIYKKKIDDSICLENLDLKSGNLCEIFGFKTKKEYEKFLYEDYSFEIFGEATVTTKNVDRELNLWLLSIMDNDDLKEPIEIILSNPYEFNTSIGNTLFFLAKTATRVRNFQFPSDSQKIWDLCDVLITADKELLKNKPSGKKSIKIKTEYNEEIGSDYTYDTLSDFLKDENILFKLEEQ